MFKWIRENKFLAGLGAFLVLFIGLLSDLEGGMNFVNRVQPSLGGVVDGVTRFLSYPIPLSWVIAALAIGFLVFMVAKKLYQQKPSEGYYDEYLGVRIVPDIEGDVTLWCAECGEPIDFTYRINENDYLVCKNEHLSGHKIPFETSLREERALKEQAEREAAEKQITEIREDETMKAKVLAGEISEADYEKYKNSAPRKSHSVFFTAHPPSEPSLRMVIDNFLYQYGEDKEKRRISRMSKLKD